MSHVVHGIAYPICSAIRRHPGSFNNVMQYTPDVDGKRFLVIPQGRRSEDALLTTVVTWLPGLER